MKLDLENLIHPFTLVEFGIVCLLIFIAKLVRDKLTHFDDDHELFKNDNPALGIAKAGYYLALFIAFRGLISGESYGDWMAIGQFAVYGVLVLTLLNIANFTVDKVVLNQFKLTDEIGVNRNEGAAWALCGGYLASASVLAGAASGDAVDSLIDGLAEVGVYFVFGQVILVVAAKAFFVVYKNMQKEIHDGNIAAGISLGGFLAAIGIILGSQSSGDMGINKGDFLDFFVYSIIGIIFLIISRLFIFNFIFASGVSLKKEIFEDKNRAAGWISAMGSIGMALLLNALV